MNNVPDITSIQVMQLNQFNQAIKSAREETIKNIFDFMVEVTWTFHKKPTGCQVCLRNDIFVTSDDLENNPCYRCALKLFQDKFLKEAKRSIHF